VSTAAFYDYADDFDIPEKSSKAMATLTAREDRQYYPVTDVDKALAASSNVPRKYLCIFCYTSLLFFIGVVFLSGVVGSLGIVGILTVVHIPALPRPGSSCARLRQ
jgi:hypothetical protein